MVEARNTITVTTWDHFVRQAAGFEAGHPLFQHYIYRGHAHAVWELHPSLNRDVQGSGMSGQEVIALEKGTLREFQRQAHLYLPQHKVHGEKELSAWWVLMQHHGCSTRILDWTRSAFVALYFAVVEERDKDGAVWAVHIQTAVEGMKSRFQNYKPTERGVDSDHFWSPQADERLYILTPLTQTDRMGAQQYAFTISQKVLCDHGEILRAATGAPSEIHVFTKILIPAALKPECLRRLREMNVTARALFPGVDGLGRSAAELVKLTCWYHSEQQAAQRRSP